VRAEYGSFSPIGSKLAKWKVASADKPHAGGVRRSPVPRRWPIPFSLRRVNPPGNKWSGAQRRLTAPILFPKYSVNHIAALWGPAAMPVGWLPAVGIRASVKVPPVVIRPILLPDRWLFSLMSCSVGRRTGRSSRTARRFACN
jgi:hypothetical protein